MKSIIRFFKFGLIFATPIGLVLVSNLASALSESQLDMFSQNDIMFYDPAEVERGNCGTSTLCGSKAKEKYWSALSKYVDDPIKVAGIMGNLVNEGDVNPVSWEIGPTHNKWCDDNGGINRSGEFYRDWDFYYNGNSECTGVGAFAITSGLGAYLQAVNNEAPDLIDYFKKPGEYSYNWGDNLGTPEDGYSYGDQLLQKIGDEIFDKLVEFEVKYAMEKFKPGKTKEYLEKSFSTPSEAAHWWMAYWEIPAWDDTEDSERKSAAEKIYAEFEDYACSGGSGSTTASSSPRACGEFVYYSQCQSEWGSIEYGAGLSSTCDSACGPASFAMLATELLGKKITPKDTTKIAGDKGMHKSSGGSDHEITKVLAEEYGLDYDEVFYHGSAPPKDELIEKINEYLKNGWMIHASGQGTSPFTPGGHYIGVRDITDDGKWLIADSNDHPVDSNHPSEKGYPGKGPENSKIEWDPQDVASGMLRSDMNVHAIKLKEGTSCESVCKESVGEEGLTIEQAKQFVMNYGENKDNSSKDAVGGSMWNMCDGGGSNCVTFSAFFMRKFANIPSPPSGLWGNGNNVVKNLKERTDIDIEFGSEPRVFSVLSNTIQHTAVVLGHHDGKWIVGHAGCHSGGIGRGNGEKNGGGAAWIFVETSDDPATWQWVGTSASFAYMNVDISKIEEYLVNGK